MVSEVMSAAVMVILVWLLLWWWYCYYRQATLAVEMEVLFYCLFLVQFAEVVVVVVVILEIQVFP